MTKRPAKRPVNCSSASRSVGALEGGQLLGGPAAQIAATGTELVRPARAAATRTTRITCSAPAAATSSIKPLQAARPVARRGASHPARGLPALNDEQVRIGRQRNGQCRVQHVEQVIARGPGEIEGFERTAGGVDEIGDGPSAQRRSACRAPRRSTRARRSAPAGADEAARRRGRGARRGRGPSAAARGIPAGPDCRRAARDTAAQAPPATVAARGAPPRTSFHSSEAHRSTSASRTQAARRGCAPRARRRSAGGRPGKERGNGRRTSAATAIRAAKSASRGTTVGMALGAKRSRSSGRSRS